MFNYKLYNSNKFIDLMLNYAITKYLLKRIPQN